MDIKSASTFSIKNTIILTLILFCSGINVCAQVKEYKLKGKYVDQYGFPMVDQSVKLKDTEYMVYTNSNGEFEFSISQPLYPFVLVYSINAHQEKEVILEESKLTEPIKIVLKDEDITATLNENYQKNLIEKPSFKQRVINTITWPYRKIRKTFFENE
jgi:hypothetical protein